MAKVVQIILLFLLSIVLLGFMFGVIFESSFFSFFNYESNVVVEEAFEIEDIETISVSMLSTDVKVNKSSSEKIEVKIYGKEDEKYAIGKNGNTLAITKKNKPKICIGFCFTKEVVEVYVPESYTNDLKIDTASGDIDIEDYFDMDVALNTKSGDVTIKGIRNGEIGVISGDITIASANDLKLSTKSGDIEVGNVKNIEADVISGDIDIDSVELSKDGSLKTISGDIVIKNANDAYFETDTVSGDVKIEHNNRYADYKMTIKTTSGDIRVK